MTKSAVKCITKNEDLMLLQNEKPVTIMTGFSFLVEAGGVGPPSESNSLRTSPGAADHLEFPSQGAGRQARCFGSFMMHDALKALRVHGRG